MASQQQLSKVYEIVTDRLIAALEQGVIPWRKPWKSADMPRNLSSGQPYRGSNVFALLWAGFSSPYWCTFKQALELGGHVKKGEKGTPVVFWRWVSERKRADGTKEELDRPFPTVRYYTVFNVEQCEGLTVPAAADAPKGFDPIAAAEQLVADMPQRPAIVNGGNQASYSPAADIVTMPSRESFYSAGGYYATLFHELTHSTAHESRVGRKVSTSFGSEQYSREELVAEMGSSFLMASCDLENDATMNNAAAYLANWLQALRADPSMLIYAGQQAQKAADFILGRAAIAPAETTEAREGGEVAAALAA
jgi:antirestriction protein ArdC